MAISIGLYSEEVYKKWDLRKGIFGTFRCHLPPVFVNIQRCFNFMTLVTILRLRILGLAVIFNYGDFRKVNQIGGLTQVKQIVSLFFSS